MTVPFENDTSHVIKKLARQSIRFDRKKSICCLLAIVVAVAMIMMSLLTVQNILHRHQEEIKDLHQGIYFDITQDSKEKLFDEEKVNGVGLSCSIKTIKEDTKEVSLIYYDDTMFALIPDFYGKYPEKANEIAVTDSFFASGNKPPEINTTIQLNMDGAVKEYTIVGICHDENTTVYPVFVSYEKCCELRGNDLLNGYVWLDNADALTKEEATEILSQISEDTGLKNWTVSSYYNYGWADLAFSNFAAYGAIAGILFLAAALVIYSIFYISVEQKIAEFGQLRTIGASSKQIYKIVMNQGYMMALPGIVVGSIAGTIISYCLQSKGWSVAAFILSFCGACLFGVLLVSISVRKPAKIAANITPISALKNQAEVGKYHKHKRHRISPAYLARINFLRNRKKSALTILSMGLCGIIFFLAASYQSSFSPESMARYWDMRRGDFKISVDLEDDNADLDSILQKEYFSNYIEQVKKTDGIRNVFAYSALPVEFSSGDHISDETLILGYNEKDAESLNKAILSGEITDKTELIVSDPDRVYDVYHWTPEIGDTVSFRFQNSSKKTVTMDLTVSAITSNGDGMGGYIFRMPEKLMRELAGYDCTYAIEIQEEPECYQNVEQKLKALIAGNEDVSLQTIEDAIIEHQTENRTGFALAYAIAAILFIFAVINQINLTIANLLAQKREMGILRSIGMTNKQLKQTFLLEGLFTTSLAIVLTCMIGIPGGYIISIFLRNAGMSTGFVFPTAAFGLFVTVMFVLGCIIPMLFLPSWKKQSAVEAIQG